MTTEYAYMSKCILNVNIQNEELRIWIELNLNSWMCLRLTEVLEVDLILSLMSFNAAPVNEHIPQKKCIES